MCLPGPSWVGRFAPGSFVWAAFAYSSPRLQTLQSAMRIRLRLTTSCLPISIRLPLPLNRPINPGFSNNLPRGHFPVTWRGQCRVRTTFDDVAHRFRPHHHPDDVHPYDRVPLCSKTVRPARACHVRFANRIRVPSTQSVSPFHSSTHRSSVCAKTFIRCRCDGERMCGRSPPVKTASFWESSPGRQ